MMVELMEVDNMQEISIRQHIRSLILEFIQEKEVIDYDNLKFLPETDISVFDDPETINRCSTFNIENLKNINSFAGKIKYLSNCLPKLGIGSARIVFQLAPTKVIKLAKNKKGLAQNEVEADNQGNASYYKNVMAQILDFDEDYLWVEMEIAKKFNTKDFFKATDLLWKEFKQGILYYRLYKSNLDIYEKRVPEHVRNNDFFAEIIDVGEALDLEFPDLEKESSYGIVERDGSASVVLIDYGYTVDVWKDFYRKKK